MEVACSFVRFPYKKEQTNTPLPSSYLAYKSISKVLFVGLGRLVENPVISTDQPTTTISLQSVIRVVLFRG